jgi:hypothetical protein
MKDGMEIAIRGEGELVIRFIDASGQTLMQERLTVSGSSKLEARRVVALSLRTVTGDTAVAPVLVKQTNPAQRVQFDGEAPSRFTRRRCKEIGCTGEVGLQASRGLAAAPVRGDGVWLSGDEPALARLIDSVSE